MHGRVLEMGRHEPGTLHPSRLQHAGIISQVPFVVTVEIEGLPVKNALPSPIFMKEAQAISAYRNDSRPHLISIPLP